MSTMKIRWRLASLTMLIVNPTVRGQHPRWLERRAGSPPAPLCAEKQVVVVANVEITDCQLCQLIAGESGFGGGVYATAHLT
eukprot:3398266-Prymnesium_polylepis.1